MDCAIGNTEDTLPLDMMNLDRFGELEAAMHPSTPTGASSQDLTRVNYGPMVSLAPRTLHLAPCTLHLAPRTSLASRLATLLPSDLLSRPWLEGAPAPLLLASRLATLSSPDLRPHLFPPFPTVTRRHGDDFWKGREWGNRDRETIP